MFSKELNRVVHTSNVSLSYVIFHDDASLMHNVYIVSESFIWSSEVRVCLAKQILNLGYQITIEGKSHFDWIVKKRQTQLIE